MKNTHYTSTALLCLIALCAACQDGYVPPEDDDPILIVGEGEEPGKPQFSSEEIALGELSGALIEGGLDVTLEVALKREPSAPVTLAVTSSNEAAGTLSPATLEFTPEDWQTPQTLTISPGDDEVASGDTVWALQFALVSEDESFHEADVPDFEVTTVDNDVAPTLVTTVMGEPVVTEQGGTAAISVQLSRQPKGEVLMQVSTSHPGEANVSVESLSFDMLTWNLPQQVVVTGVDDGVKDGDTQFVVSFGPANSVDEAFNGIGPFGVTLTNIDGVCGNGVVDGAEVCEPDGSTGCPPGEETCMICTNACELIETDGSSFCGDGITQVENGEECDEPERACAYGEESCQTCRACKLIPGQITGYCGDGQVQGSAGEACDEPTQPCEYGETSCMTCEACQIVAGEVTGYCGDGVVQSAQGETCEDPEEACVYGQMSCQTCRDCKTVAGMVSGYCGDGVVQYADGETCDGDPTSNGVTCARRQHGGVCQSDCQLDEYDCRNENLVISAGVNFTCGITSAGGVKCWGDNTDGQLGTGSMGGVQNTPVAVQGLSSGVRQVSAGYQSACALKFDGEVRCWGWDYGASPIQIIAPGAGAKKVAVGVDHACALGSNSQVVCWGDNTYSQRGQGAMSGTFSNTVTGLGQGITDIEAGGYHTCVRFGIYDEVKCWGANFDGQLGFSTAGSVSSDSQRITNLSGVRSLSLGDHHSCALTSSGVKCWGDNSLRQLGDNTTSSSTAPRTASAAGSNVIAIGAGLGHTCALSSTGNMRCWGRHFGWSWIGISGISGDVDQIGAGLDETCLAMSSGTVECFSHTVSSVSDAMNVSGF